jgi:hypothetical protein
MQMNNKIIFSLIFSILLIGIASAEMSLNLNMKDSFSTGEKIYLNYSIFSSENAEIQYAIFVFCPNAPLPLFELKNASLTANVLFNGNYTYFSSLNESIEPQICNASIGVLAPETIVHKTFEIKTLPSFEINLHLCQFDLCNFDNGIFLLNKNISVEYSASVSGILLDALLKYPNGNIERIIADQQIFPSQSGDYELLVTSSKNGYKTINKNIKFKVISNEPEIKYVDFDMAKQEAKFLRGMKIVYPILIGLGVISIGIIVYFIVKNIRKKNANEIE